MMMVHSNITRLAKIHRLKKLACRIPGNLFIWSLPGRACVKILSLLMGSASSASARGGLGVGLASLLVSCLSLDCSILDSLLGSCLFSGCISCSFLGSYLLLRSILCSFLGSCVLCSRLFGCFFGKRILGRSLFGSFLRSCLLDSRSLSCFFGGCLLGCGVLGRFLGDGLFVLADRLLPRRHLLVHGAPGRLDLPDHLGVLSHGSIGGELRHGGGCLDAQLAPLVPILVGFIHPRLRIDERREVVDHQIPVAIPSSCRAGVAHAVDQ
mmetsp:Transcript_42171/g.98444  ORF Transcript_42171/g.98444 Transcript_42171/m.98444 type:complete len:267 (-) Transcript_42171:2483-3283(-)